MHPFPHLYSVQAAATPVGAVTLSAVGLTPLPSNGPKEFDGPGDLWSPETLLTAALADCFVLSFRAVATASKFEWLSLQCGATGTLDRIERISQFTEFTLHAKLTVAAGADLERARKLLEKSEQVCLISASLKSAKHLNIEIVSR